MVRSWGLEGTLRIWRLAKYEEMVEGLDDWAVSGVVSDGLWCACLLVVMRRLGGPAVVLTIAATVDMVETGRVVPRIGTVDGESVKGIEMAFQGIV